MPENDIPLPKIMVYPCNRCVAVVPSQDSRRRCTDEFSPVFPKRVAMVVDAGAGVGVDGEIELEVEVMDMGTCTRQARAT